MRNFVKYYVRSRGQCAYNKYQGGQQEGEYHYGECEAIPFHTIHLDHLGPFPKSAKGNEHLLVLIDSFTKYVIIRPVISTATKFVIGVLNEVSSYFGVPKRIISDRGTPFTSKEFKSYCRENIIIHILNAVRTPRANGQVEQAKRTILNMLLPTTNEDKRWDQKLRDIQWTMNSNKNQTTKITPQELLFGFTPRDILQNKVVQALHHGTRNDGEQLQRMREQAAENIQRQREYAKQKYDARHKISTTHELNDFVLVENEPISTGSSRKLEPRYKGPFTVSKVLGNDRDVIEDITGSNRKQMHYFSVYSSDKLKPWCCLLPFEDDDNDEIVGEDA